mgnify:CR=1 FL=1|jgi:hypothetical protein
MLKRNFFRRRCAWIFIVSDLTDYDLFITYIYTPFTSGVGKVSIVNFLNLNIVEVNILPINLNDLGVTLF